MANKSNKTNKENNIVSFPNPSQNTPIDGAFLREEYEAEQSDEEEVSDEVAEFVLNQLSNVSEDYNYKELLLGLNKAYLQVLLQLVEDSGFDSEEFLEFFYEEADRLAKTYLIGNKSENFDPVKASGALALASSYIFEAIDD